jgi:hypothetical protein
VVAGAAGGVIAYRSYFLAPRTTIVVGEGGVSTLPDMTGVFAGLALLLAGAAAAFFAARRR